MSCAISAVEGLSALLLEQKAAFNAQGLRPEVEKFLEIAQAQRWVVLA